MGRSLTTFINKLTARTRLTNEECRAVLSLRGQGERIETHKSFAILGDPSIAATLVIEGLCARVDMPSEDKRQITAIYIEGDMPDLYSLFQPETLAMMEALTPAYIVRIPHGEIRAVMSRFPAVAEAFARHVVADAAITAEWLINVGGRDARAALAHLLCEMAVRMGRVAGDSFSFHFPMSQMQLSEATGLSAVHVNRSLGRLREAGLAKMERGTVLVLDWPGLTAVAHFNDRYLTPGGARRFAN